MDTRRYMRSRRGGYMQIETLKIPRSLFELLREATSGILLVSGPPGSGKSVTLAALEEWLARLRGGQGLDLLLVDEIDETVSLDELIRKAEEGSLVLVAARARTALMALEDLIEQARATRESGVVDRLADNLIGIVSQCLLARASGDGRVPAFEIYPATKVVRTCIREGRLFQIPSCWAGSRIPFRFMNESLAYLVLDGSISREVALLASPSPEGLIDMLARRFPPAGRPRPV